ncbi:MAG TPA: hypothetical protein VJ180_08085 [Pyrinomonadaceae bacterium]|nr:hypothetical protein [Pyrinomonadaceae bacterium]
MDQLEGLKLFLTVVSGVCWTIVYLDGIRLGIKDQSYAIPFYALAMNICWEVLQTVYGFQAAVSVQTIINAVWFVFDLGILFTYFQYGRKYFPANLPARTFIVGSILGLVTALCVEFAFIREFGLAVGAGYSAFLQNLLMSVLFIDMLVKRGSREGQSLTIAVNKWVGTLAPTILFGVPGEGGFPNGSFLILSLGIFCSVFDLLYIWMLLKLRLT